MITIQRWETVHACSLARIHLNVRVSGSRVDGWFYLRAVHHTYARLLGMADLT